MFSQHHDQALIYLFLTPLFGVHLCFLNLSIRRLTFFLRLSIYRYSMFFSLYIWRISTFFLHLYLSLFYFFLDFLRLAFCFLNNSIPSMFLSLSIRCYPILSQSLFRITLCLFSLSTVCPRSSYPFYIVSYYIRWVNYLYIQHLANNYLYALFTSIFLVFMFAVFIGIYLYLACIYVCFNLY